MSKYNIAVSSILEDNYNAIKDIAVVENIVSQLDSMDMLDSYFSECSFDATAFRCSWHYYADIDELVSDNMSYLLDDFTGAELAEDANLLQDEIIQVLEENFIIITLNNGYLVSY